MASSKEKRLAIFSEAPHYLGLVPVSQVSTVQPQARQGLMAVDAWTIANSGWELWTGAAGQGVNRKKYNSCSQEHNTKVICTHTFSERSSHLLNSHLRNGELSLCQEQSKTDPDTRSKATTVISSSPDSIVKRQDTALTSCPGISVLVSDISNQPLPPTTNFPVCSAELWEQQKLCNILWEGRRAKQHY